MINKVYLDVERALKNNTFRFSFLVLNAHNLLYGFPYVKVIQRHSKFTRLYLRIIKEILY